VQETRLDTARIRAARRVIDPVFLDTPLYRCEALEPGLGCAVSIKLVSGKARWVAGWFGIHGGTVPYWQFPAVFPYL